MAERVIQASFNAGELAPALYARTDLNKYHSAAALLRNFFVDYRGGASSRPGTRFVTFAQNSAAAVRLIPFQASTTVNYICEFGAGYIRFIANGALVMSNGVPYSIASPYAAADLALLKFAQSVNKLVICHPNYPPQVLTLNTATNWTIAPIPFGSSAGIPVGVSATTSLSSGSCSYSYCVTSVDANGQESAASAPCTLTNLQDIRSVNGTNRISWTAVAGAQRYNIYKSDVAYFATIPAGVPYGYLGTASGTSFDDSNTAPNFDDTPPVFRDVLNGDSVASVVITTPGTYSAVPAVTFVGTATTVPTFQASIVPGALTANNSGQGYFVNDFINMPNGQNVIVTATSKGGAVSGYTVSGGSTFTNTNPPGNPMAGSGGSGGGFTASAVYTLSSIVATTPGAGIAAGAGVTISGNGGGAASLTISPPGYGYPSVPAFYQQRLFLGGPTMSPANFNLSQPGSYYNYNVSFPSQASDSITGTLVSNQLNSIKSAISTAAGLIILTDRASWLINGGSAGSAVSPSTIVANEQSRVGASDLPPITSNYDILYVQAKGSVVRDSTYNFYANVYTGEDITAISSHLFYGYTLKEWASAEEPFKLVWVVRSDGTLLTLTFLKEQQLIAWSHSDSPGGTFVSVASVPELVNGVLVDAVYFAVQRSIGGQNLISIERLSERQWSTASGCVCVDAAITYSGAPATQFSGAQSLAGLTVTGLADGKVIPPFVMPASGSFTLPTAASVVSVGIGFTCQLQTLALDIGDPTVQSKMKKITAVTLRLAVSLGLKIGSSFKTLVPMKDTTLGMIGGMTNTPVTDVVSGDARTILDPTYTVPGQYCIQQDQPLPASILGVIPQFELGDTVARR